MRGVASSLWPGLQIRPFFSGYFLGEIFKRGRRWQPCPSPKRSCYEPIYTVSSQKTGIFNGTAVATSYLADQWLCWISVVDAEQFFFKHNIVFLVGLYEYLFKSARACITVTCKGSASTAQRTCWDMEECFWKYSVLPYTQNAYLSLSVLPFLHTVLNFSASHFCDKPI
jgi:hypothetical protein